MHSLAVELFPILAAAKSKVPFYIAGGALVLWALVVSLVLGLRNADFPGNLQGQRMVSAITAVLVLGAISTAVITSGSDKTAAAAARPASQSQPAAPAGAPAPTGGTAPSGGTAAGAASGATTSLALAANTGGLLSYDTKQLSAKAGSVTITMSNSSPIEHNLTIAQGSTVLGATPTFVGGSRSLTVALKPGTYTFYCSVPGHRQAGMEGTLKVS